MIRRSWVVWLPAADRDAEARFRVAGTVRCEAEVVRREVVDRREACASFRFLTTDRAEAADCDLRCSLVRRSAEVPAVLAGAWTEAVSRRLPVVDRDLVAPEPVDRAVNREADVADACVRARGCRRTRAASDRTRSTVGPALRSMLRVTPSGRATVIWRSPARTVRVERRVSVKFTPPRCRISRVVGAAARVSILPREATEWVTECREILSAPMFRQGT